MDIQQYGNVGFSSKYSHLLHQQTNVIPKRNTSMDVGITKIVGFTTAKKSLVLITGIILRSRLRLRLSLVDSWS